jgi:hypothetical protein
MKIEQAFGYTVIRVQCPDPSIYKDPDLTNAVNRVFKMSTVQTQHMKGRKSFSQKGNGFTTVGEEYLAISALPGSGRLNQWISQQMLEARSLLGIEKEGNAIKFKRSWANRMHRGGYGKCHMHVKIDEYIAELTNYTPWNFCPDIVGIMYIDVPPGSSKLMLINNGKEYSELDIYPEEDRHYITPVEGELVLHTPDVWHGVSIHESDLPRTCYVYDADFV